MSLKNKENLRRCFKCGRSPAEDQTITLFRFPKPGKTNTLRCELWARYCFPDREWFSPEFQHKLHSEHKMLCSRHFPRTSFSDYPLSTKKLHRFAVPDDIKKIEPQPGTSQTQGNIDLSPVAMVGEARPLESTTDKPMLEPVKEPSHVVRVLQDSSNLTTMSKASLLSLESTIDMPISEPVQEPSHILQHSTNLSSVAMVSEATNIEKPMIQPVPGTSKSNMAPIKSEKTKKERYLYAKCRKHMKAICQLRKRVMKLKNKAYLHELQSCDSIGILTKKLTPTFALLLQAQIKNFKKKSKGRRWTTDEKITALRLYKRSPTCYRLMRRLFCLPAQSTLKSLLSYFSLEVGVNDAIFSVLSKTADIQKPSDNEYVLMFDEMSIKKNMMYNKNKDVIEGFQDHGLQGRCSLVASHALVFMIAGIRKKVKQPIAYYLSSSYVTADRLAVLIKEILHECLRAGISITSTVCDMDGVNRRALAILGATVEKPYITVDNVEVVTMYDPPHLLKCFRNLFMKYNIKCTTEINSNNKSGVGVAKWSHVKDFYELDNKNPNFVFAPALKPEHLNPNSKQKMRVKLAAQALSHTVAAGMMAKISDGQLTTEAVVTVDVIEKIDKMFDTLNSDSSDLRRGKVYSTNLKSTTPHLKLISEMKSFFKTSEFVGCNRAPPSKDGWIWTLNAVERIWGNLTKKHSDIKSLATRRLQQDPLENMFGCIRGNCGANYNPTAGQFIAALKTAILSKLATQGSTGNCESDVCQSIINNYKMILTKKDTNICTGTSEPHNFPLPSETEMSEELESSGEIQACAYVCGFLIKNLDNFNNCENCKNILLSNENLKEHLFVSCKEYNSMKNSLIYCNKDFIVYIEHCATEINKMLESISHELHLMKKITEKVKNCVNSSFLKPCAAHYEKNVNYFVKSVSFICTKRFCILRNRAFTEEASKAALKRKIDILKHK